MRGVVKEAQSLGRFYIVSLSGDEIDEPYARLDTFSPRPRQVCFRLGLPTTEFCRPGLVPQEDGADEPSEDQPRYVVRRSQISGLP